MKLNWKPREFVIFGTGYELAGIDGDDYGTAYRRASGRYVAMATIKGKFMFHEARTQRSAIDRLNREIDKRSIGLFGVDNILIEVL